MVSVCRHVPFLCSIKGPRSPPLIQARQDRPNKACIIRPEICCRSSGPVRLSAESVNYLTVFFSHNESTNSIFCHGLSAKQTISTFFELLVNYIKIRQSLLHELQPASSFLKRSASPSWYCKLKAASQPTSTMERSRACHTSHQQLPWYCKLKAQRSFLKAQTTLAGTSTWLSICSQPSSFLKNLLLRSSLL